MKKTIIPVLISVLLIVCLFAGCNGAQGGKVTDNQQNLTEAVTEIREMITEASEMFTSAEETLAE